MRSLQAARDRYPTILAAILMAALVITTLVTSGPAAADTDDDSDDTRAGAYDLGDITNQARVATETGSLDGVDDTVDYFRFSLTDTREVMLKLRQLDAPTHLYLEDQDGNVLASSKNPAPRTRPSHRNWTPAPTTPGPRLPGEEAIRTSSVTSPRRTFPTMWQPPGRPPSLERRKWEKP